MDNKLFFREKSKLERELADYINNDEHDHHQGYMHRRYDEFYNVIEKYKELLFSENFPNKKEAREELIKFLDEELVQKLKAKKCEYCTAIANLIQVECMPK